MLGIAVYYYIKSFSQRFKFLDGIAIRLDGVFKPFFPLSFFVTAVQHYFYRLFRIGECNAFRIAFGSGVGLFGCLPLFEQAAISS